MVVILCQGKERKDMKLIDIIYNKLLMQYYGVKKGKGFSCSGRLIIQGHGKYIFGDNLLINSKTESNPIGGNRTVFRTLQDTALIKVGNNVGMSHAVLCARIKIIIEDNVLLGAGCKIFDNDFHSLSYKERIEGSDNDINGGEIYIREGAFIGAAVLILKGVVIGKHSVIGAGAVVTKDIPDYEIWAGNPARKIGIVKD